MPLELKLILIKSIIVFRLRSEEFRHGSSCQVVTLMNYSSPPPPPPQLTASSDLCSQMLNDHMLDISPRPSHHMNHFSAELVNEITRLEVEILHLEHYLLSLYRAAFQQYLPSNQGNHGTHVQPMTGIPRWLTLDQPHRENLERFKEYDDRTQSSPTSTLSGPSDIFQIGYPKSFSRREKKSDYFLHHSLADHLGDLNFSNRLSEDIIRCISSIYRKLANPPKRL